MTIIMFRQMTHPDELNITCKWMPGFSSDTLITNKMIFQLYWIEERDTVLIRMLDFNPYLSLHRHCNTHCNTNDVGFFFFFSFFFFVFFQNMQILHRMNSLLMRVISHQISAPESKSLANTIRQIRRNGLSTTAHVNQKKFNECQTFFKGKITIKCPRQPISSYLLCNYLFFLSFSIQLCLNLHGSDLHLHNHPVHLSVL